MKIIELKEFDDKWKNFLKEKKHLIFHRPEWKQFTEDSFDIKMKYFAVDHIKDNYFNYDYLQVREGVPEKYLMENGFKKVEEANRFILNLDKEEKIWKSISKQKRKAVRKAQDMKVEVRDIGYHEVSRVYNIYLSEMKGFGVPAFPIKYFDNFWYYMIENGLGKALGAYLDGTLIAALLGFTYNDRVHITISVSKKGYLDYRPNDILHWEFIRWILEEKRYY